MHAKNDTSKKLLLERYSSCENSAWSDIGEGLRNMRRESRQLVWSTEIQGCKQTNKHKQSTLSDSIKTDSITGKESQSCQGQSSEDFSFL